MSDRTYVFDSASQGVDVGTAALLANSGNNRGNNGSFGVNSVGDLIGLIIAAGIFGNGNGFGFGGGGNNNAEREMLMQAISRNGNDINSLANQFNCTAGQVTAAINGLAGLIAQMQGTIGLSSQQIINSIQAGNSALASQLCNCCCEIRQAIAESNYLTERGFCNTNQIISKGFSDLGYATRDQTCAIEKAIEASTSRVLEGQRAAEMRELQRALNQRARALAQRDVIINNYQQTQTFGAMLQPLSNAIGHLQNDVDGIKCKLPKTETIIASPEYVPVNRGINVNYGIVPACGYGYGYPGYGFNNGNGPFF